MRILIALSAAAPLALLAACGDSTPADEAPPAPAATVADAPAAADPTMPQPVESLEGVEFAGDYSLTDEAGGTSRLTLRDDDTYAYTPAGGTLRSGKYRRDGSRIVIDDFDNGAGYFSVANGALYRLPAEDTPYNEITVNGMYRRENAPVQENGPDATTDSVADKRG